MAKKTSVKKKPAARATRAAGRSVKKATRARSAARPARGRKAAPAARRTTKAAKAKKRTKKATPRRAAARKVVLRKSAATTKAAAKPAAARKAAVKQAAPRKAAPTKAAPKKAAPKKAPAMKATAKRPPARAAAGAVPARTKAPVARHTPALDRERRTVGDAAPASTPSSFVSNRHASAASSGSDELRVKLASYTGTGPAITAGDVDANWESAESVGDEAPGGDNPTPDQDVVDEIGRALGVEYDDNEELQGGDEITARDHDRWELDPASSDDFDER